MTSFDKVAKLRKATEAFWNSLRRFERLELSDQLVLGTFDLLDWDLKPGSISLNYLDKLRMDWEVWQ